MPDHNNHIHFLSLFWLKVAWSANEDTSNCPDLATIKSPKPAIAHEEACINHFVAKVDGKVRCRRSEDYSCSFCFVVPTLKCPMSLPLILNWPIDPPLKATLTQVLACYLEIINEDINVNGRFVPKL